MPDRIRPHGQYRAPRLPEYLLCYRTQRNPLEPGAAVRTYHDQIDLLALDYLCKLRPDLAFEQNGPVIDFIEALSDVGQLRTFPALHLNRIHSKRCFGSQRGSDVSYEHRGTV